MLRKRASRLLGTPPASRKPSDRPQSAMAQYSPYSPASPVSEHRALSPSFDDFDFGLDKQVEVRPSHEPLFHDIYLSSEEEVSPSLYSSGFSSPDIQSPYWATHGRAVSSFDFYPTTIPESEEMDEHFNADEQFDADYEEPYEFDSEADVSSSDEDNVVATSVSIVKAGKPRVVSLSLSRMPTSPTSESSGENFCRSSSVSSKETPYSSRSESFSQPSTAASSISESSDIVPSSKSANAHVNKPFHRPHLRAASGLGSAGNLAMIKEQERFAFPQPRSSRQVASLEIDTMVRPDYAAAHSPLNSPHSTASSQSRKKHRLSGMLLQRQ